MSMEETKLCSACDGSGICHVCGGTGKGQHVNIHPSNFYDSNESVPCPACNGSTVCVECGGRGRVPR